MRSARSLLALCLAAASAAALPAQPRDQAEPAQKIEKREVLVFRGAGDEAVEIVAAPGSRGFLGVNLLDITPELRRHFGVPDDRGVLVSRVLDDSPAARGGLRAGDVLTALDGEAMPSAQRLSLLVAQADQDQVVDVEYWRERRRGSVAVPLDVRQRTLFDLSPLVKRRIALEPHQVVRLHSGHEEAGTEIEWIGDLVGQLDDGMAQATFVQQLETMRLERGALQRHIERLEQRLEQLEAELRELAED